MSSSLSVRLPRWPFSVLLLLVAVGLWLLDARQPDAWSDAATPWYEHVRALSPASRAIDAVNARVPLTPDLPLGSAVVVLAIAATTLATLLTIEVPPLLAIAVALGLAATRSVWSTVTPGNDALDIAIVACAVLAVARSWCSTRASVATVIATIGLAPSAAWCLAPGVAAMTTTRRRCWGLALGLVVLSLCVHVVLLRQIWSGLACLAPGAWLAGLPDIVRPGHSADASAWLAVRQATAVLTGDVHLFGLAVAALGLWHASGASRRLRRTTFAVVAVAVMTTATGLTPPGATAALLLPWWAVWFGRGLVEVMGGTSGSVRPIALAFGVAIAMVPPLLRHTSVAPEPWIAGMPAITRSVADSWRGSVVASEDGVLTRRLRVAGATMLPADASTLGRCVAAGQPIHALGPTIPQIERLGHRVTERPLHAPFSAVLRDLRADQLVALALAPAAIPWAGPSGLAVLSRVSVARDTVTGNPAVGVVARTDRSGEVRAGRAGIDLTQQAGDVVGGRTLLAPLSVSAHDHDASVGSGSIRLATSHYAALAVFDRSQDVSLRAVGETSPGLPMPLMREAAWRQVDVSDSPACAPGSRRWTAFPSRAQRISVPVAAASRRRPVLLYLASQTPPTVGVSGLPAHPLRPGWAAETFDTQVSADANRLTDLQQQDDVPPAMRPRTRWITRVSIAPLGPWDADRVAVSAGTAAESWLVTLAAEGRRRETTAVCSMAAAGDRLLHGQYGVLDDDSASEIAVWAADGWHPAERLHGDVFQWTARPTATAVFHLGRPTPLTLAMDAAGSGTAAGPQPITVRVNGQVLRSDWEGTGRLTLPVDVLRAGDNDLSLEVAQVVQPPRDTRALGVLVRQLRVIDSARR